MEGTRSGPVSGTILHFPGKAEKSMNVLKQVTINTVCNGFLGINYLCKLCNSCCSLSINNLKQFVEGCLNNVQYSTLKYADWAEFGIAVSM